MTSGGDGFAPGPDDGPGQGEPVPPTLLFVDDDTYMRRLMTVRLEHLGAQVESVASAQAALAFLESNRPDLIVSDAVMPGMDGFDLCRRVKDDPLLQSIPFVILTSLTRDLRQRSFEAGADDFLSKLEHEVVFRLRVRLALDLGVGLAALPGEENAIEGASILVVSESRAIHAQMETNLQKDGISVHGAASLDEAFLRLQTLVPDALALDLALDPKTLGDWIARARALPGCLALPTLALAAKEEEAWLAPLEYHIQDRLLKPLDGQESRRRVKLLLRIARL